jgi:LysM repeat protein
MRFNAIGILALFLVLSSMGCQDTEVPATEAPVEVSPAPTPAVGVDFATATLAGRATGQAVVQTPAASPPPTETAAPTPETYTVQSGDTLVGIAAARGVSLEELLGLNPDIQPELLLVGQEIIVPPGPEIQPTAAPVDDGPISVEISGLTTYVSATGGTWVLGEIINRGSRAVELLQVQMSLVSSEEGLQASQMVWITPVTIPTAGQAPFGALFSDVSPVGVSARAEIVGGREVNDLGNRYLDLAVTDAEVTIGRNPIRVSGTIENRGQDQAGRISIVTTFYDDQGWVTGFHELIMDETIGSGESQPFAFTALPPGGRADAYTFAVQATAVE